MKRLLPVISIFSFILCSCSSEKVIPFKELADIYSEMYLADQSVQKMRRSSPLTDTLKIYEPILKKHGYTLDDYCSTLSLYLKRPDKFEEVFDISIARLEARKKVLEAIISANERSLEKWRFRDSVLSAVRDSSRTNTRMRSLETFFFEKDTSLIKDSPVPDSSAMASYMHNALELYLTRQEQADTIKPFRVVPPSAVRDTALK